VEARLAVDVLGGESRRDHDHAIHAAPAELAQQALLGGWLAQALGQQHRELVARRFAAQEPEQVAVDAVADVRHDHADDLAPRAAAHIAETKGELAHALRGLARHGLVAAQGERDGLGADVRRRRHVGQRDARFIHHHRARRAARTR
jgi:hypothetical protein